MKLTYLTQTHQRLAMTSGVEGALHQLAGTARIGWTYAVEADGHRWELQLENPRGLKSGSIPTAMGYHGDPPATRGEIRADVRYVCLGSAPCADCHEVKQLADREAALRRQREQIDAELDEIQERTSDWSADWKKPAAGSLTAVD